MEPLRYHVKIVKMNNSIAAKSDVTVTFETIFEGMQSRQIYERAVNWANAIKDYQTGTVVDVMIKFENPNVNQEENKD